MTPWGGNSGQLTLLAVATMEPREKQQMGAVRAHLNLGKTHSYFLDFNSFTISSTSSGLRRSITR